VKQKFHYSVKLWLFDNRVNLSNYQHSSCSPMFTSRNCGKFAGYISSVSYNTSNLSKAHVTCNSSGPATLAVYSNKILMCLERVLKFETSVW